MTELGDSQKGRPSLVRAALFGLCPDCGARTLFKTLISFDKHCSACNLAFDRYNVGDGPAALLIMLVGAILVPAAIAVHFAFRAPFWVHLLLWVPLALALTLAGLRVAKAALLAAEHFRARPAEK
jgi:uncharacterized protein (DUF983 family)